MITTFVHETRWYPWKCENYHINTSNLLAKEKSETKTCAYNLKKIPHMIRQFNTNESI